MGQKSERLVSQTSLQQSPAKGHKGMRFSAVQQTIWGAAGGNLRRVESAGLQPALQCLTAPWALHSCFWKMLQLPFNNLCVYTLETGPGWPQSVTLCLSLRAHCAPPHKDLVEHFLLPKP